MKNYREAKCIELHNSNIAITTNDNSYASTAPTGRTEDPNKPAFSIKLHDIAMLAEMFNIDTAKSVKIPKLSSQSIATPGETDKIQFAEIPIYKNHFDVSDNNSGEKIIKLECQIISDRIVNIKTTSKPISEDEQYVEEITYCGSFTIWW